MLITVTDPTPIPTDDRCPKCGAPREARIQSQSFGPVHDVCGSCWHDFVERTVPDTPVMPDLDVE
ncbi:MAG TPA: hypothetical protein VM243_11850 [Phycisphaerae bacterium]|nr:hypothetical protein [Phycisphaerae bacterium]